MHNKITGKRFLEVTILNLLITIVEFIGGLLSASLALMSDAFHNLGDSFSIILGYFAQAVSGKPETSRRTYGYRRAEILAALVNAVFLIIVSVFLIVEAVKRLQQPAHIKGGIMLAVAIIGFIANFISAMLLHSGSRHSLNVKATYLHVLSDALASFAVIIGGIILMFVNLPWLDPMLTIAVALYIAYEAWPVIRQTVSILMQTAPRLNFNAIKHDVLQINGVVAIHHIHAWMIDEKHIIFSAHLNCLNMPLKQVEEIYSKVEKLLFDKYHICHVTIQAEFQRGNNENFFDTRVDEKYLIK